MKHTHFENLMLWRAYCNRRNLHDPLSNGWTEQTILLIIKGTCLVALVSRLILCHCGKATYTTKAIIWYTYHILCCNGKHKQDANQESLLCCGWFQTKSIVPDGVTHTLVVCAMTSAQVLFFEAPHQHDLGRARIRSGREGRATCDYVATEVGGFFDKFDLQ